MKNDYIFTSERLGFRNWKDEDLTAFAEINADAKVMEHFPKTLSTEETSDSISRFQKHFEERGYTYFAVDILDSSEFIGFIGMYYQDYETYFTPATDIGWRLKRSSWGKGYATEGAKRCLEYAFEELLLEKIISICPASNTKSENVMTKIGMSKIGEFKHPKLSDYPEIEDCVCYEIEKTQ